MKKLLLFLVGLGLLIAGTAYWINSGNNGGDNGYSFESVKYGTMTDVVNATGIVKPSQVALVFCKVPGIVEEIIGKLGQKVEKDQPLFRVNTEMAKLTLDRAKAALEKTKGLQNVAKQGLDKVKIYYDRDHATDQQYLEAQAKVTSANEAVKEAETALKQANLAMEWTTVKSPIAGIIIEKNLYIGQPVGFSAAMGGGSSGGGSGTGQSGLGGGPSSGGSTSSLFGMTELRVPFIIASDLGEMEVYAQISQGDIGRVKAGQKAKFTVDGFPEEVPFEGEVTEINLMPVNVQGATFYPAVIKVRNRHEGEADNANKAPNADKAAKQGDKDWVLRPGMTVNVDITRDTHEHVWKLPQAASSLQLGPHQITSDAQKKLDTRQKLPTPENWVVVWTMKDKKPWPIFAWVGGKRDGKLGIKENNYSEVLEWDPNPGIPWHVENNKESDLPQLIIGAPQPKQSIFQGGTPFKIS